MKPFDVVIIGAGPSGIAAASALAGNGLSLLLIDENPAPGGQLWRRTLVPASGPRHRNLPDMIGTARDLEILTRATLLGIFPENRVLVSSPEAGCMEIRARHIVFATGARERVIPFRGWTLPGVMTQGAAQILLKSHGVLAAENFLLQGAGPLLYLLGAQLLKAGGSVRAILDQGSPLDMLTLAGRMGSQWDKALQGATAAWHLLRKRARIRPRERVVEARGNACLEEVVTVRLSPDGSPVEGSQRRYRTSALACGSGFVPNIELPRLAGCGILYRKNHGGWVVAVDDRMETSVAGTFAAGEITGVAGGEKGIVEGRIAALSILARLEKLNPREAERQQAALLRRRRRLERFGAALNRLWQTPAADYESLPDETVICRCQDVSMGTIRRWIRQGAGSLHALKKATRCGMGNCQGRTCGPLIHQILTDLAGAPDPLPFSVRTPVKPVTLGELSRCSPRQPRP